MGHADRPPLRRLSRGDLSERSSAGARSRHRRCWRSHFQPELSGRSANLARIGRFQAGRTGEDQSRADRACRRPVRGLEPKDVYKRQAETRVHLFQRTAKLDLVFSHVQQRGLNDGFRLLEPSDFLSRVNAVFLEVVDALLEGGYLLFEFAGRGFRLSLAVDPIPGRLPQPIGRALPRFLDGADHLGVHADRQQMCIRDRYMIKRKEITYKTKPNKNAKAW